MNLDFTAGAHLRRQVLTFKFRKRDELASDFNWQECAANFVGNVVRNRNVNDASNIIRCRLATFVEGIRP